MIARLVMLIDRPGRREAARGGHGAMIAHSRSMLGQVGGARGGGLLIKAARARRWNLYCLGRIFVLNREAPTCL
jgi:hypothetical protein